MPSVGGGHLARAAHVHARSYKMLQLQAIAMLRKTHPRGVSLLHWREQMGRLPKRKAAMLRVLQSPGKLSQRPAAGPSGLKLILAPWADAVAQELAPSLSRMSCISCVDRAHPIASSKRIVAHLSTSPRPGAPGPSGLKLILAPATT